MSSRLALMQQQLGCGYGVYLLLDISRVWPVPEKYYVALTYNCVIQRADGPLDWKNALEFFDAQVVAGAPKRSWHAVLERLMDKEPEPRGVWVNSPGEYMSRFFPIGSWDWVRGLIEARKRLEEAQRAA